MKFGSDEVLMVPHICLLNRLFGQIRPGVDQGRGKKKVMEWPHVQRTSSPDRKATATTQMHNSDLKACGRKRCYFWYHSEVKFFTHILSIIWLCRFRLIFFHVLLVFMQQSVQYTISCFWIS